MKCPHCRDGWYVGFSSKERCRECGGTGDKNDRPRLQFFRRLERGKLRHGIWMMVKERTPDGRDTTGMFFHGDRDEAQAPRFSQDELNSYVHDPESAFHRVEEITAREAIQELEGWEGAQRAVIQVVERTSGVRGRLENDPR